MNFAKTRFDRLENLMSYNSRTAEVKYCLQAGGKFTFDIDLIKSFRSVHWYLIMFWNSLKSS